MRTYDRRWLKAGVAKEMRRRALQGFFRGSLNNPHDIAYFKSCEAYHIPTGTQLILTRDAEMHTCGWFKNPDYERCWHLSLSFFDVETNSRADKDPQLTDEWLALFFGDDKRLLWAEPPSSEIGKRADCWHYRLFCDEHWQPILPRGEVYSRELTEVGWKSFSEVQALSQV